mgnify:CR=1 FL=1
MIQGRGLSTVVRACRKVHNLFEEYSSSCDHIVSEAKIHVKCQGLLGFIKNCFILLSILSNTSDETEIL